VIFETAPNSGSGPGSWTQRYSESWNSAVKLTSTQFELKAGTWQSEATAPGKVFFDNFLFTNNNQAPAPSLNNVSPTSCTTAGGTVLTLTGSQFVSGATVTLGGGAATNVTVNSSSSITATALAHAAGLVDVIVTNPDGQSATLFNSFTYTNPA